jgi:DNA polymerase I-like protein with 3'-5' exonuclease and polymerase domains
MITKYCTFDYESDPDWGLDVWHPDFKLISCDFKFVDGDKIKYLYSEDLKEIKSYLKAAMKQEFTLVAHNFSYEWLVTKRVFNLELPPDKCIDTLRLALGLAKGNKMGLAELVNEYFGVKDYKDPYHQYLIDNKIAKNKKDAKAKVGLLPPELLQKYNREDVDYTEKLMLRLLPEAQENPMWEQDMELYMRRVRRYSNAYLRGIKVVREGFEKAEREHNKCIVEAQAKFREKYADAIEKAEILIAKSKQEKDYQTRTANQKKHQGEAIAAGRNPSNKPLKEKAWEEFREEFNLNSTSQLVVLFIDVLGLKCRIFTEKGEPSFKADYLSQYGEAGLAMKAWKSKNKPLSDIKAYLEHSAIDGRIHGFVRTGATRTSRGSSGRV